MVIPSSIHIKLIKKSSLTSAKKYKIVWLNKSIAIVMKLWFKMKKKRGLAGASRNLTPLGQIKYINSMIFLIKKYFPIKGETLYKRYFLMIYKV